MMSLGKKHPQRMSAPASPRAAFSLLEVVAALGIFAIAMVGVIGLFAPVAKSTGAVVDSEAATNVASVLAAKLQGQSIATVGPLLKVATGPTRHQLTDADNAPNSTAADPRTDPQLLFASRDGTKIGAYNDPIWNLNGVAVDTEKFFEIALIRNETLSPPSSTTTADDGTTVVTNPDDTAFVLAYSARIRWPAFVPDVTSTRRALPFGFNAGGAPRFDNSQKQVLFFSGTVSR
jgi:type II secretory pathway pseudopilin PulG